MHVSARILWNIWRLLILWPVAEAWREHLPELDLHQQSSPWKMELKPSVLFFNLLFYRWIVKR